MDSYSEQQMAGTSPPISRKLFFQGKKDEILDLMKEVKVRVKGVEKSNSELAKPMQINRNYIRKFFARCNMLKAKLYTYLEEDSAALMFIQTAMDHL